MTVFLFAIPLFYSGLLARLGCPSNHQQKCFNSSVLFVHELYATQHKNNITQHNITQHNTTQHTMTKKAKPEHGKIGQCLVSQQRLPITPKISCPYLAHSCCRVGCRFSEEFFTSRFLLRFSLYSPKSCQFPWVTQNPSQKLCGPIGHNFSKPTGPYWPERG